MSNSSVLARVGLALWTMLASVPSIADAPSFKISQIYSNLDGTTQFVRLTETQGLNGQYHFAGLTLTSTRNGIIKQFVFPNDLPTDQTLTCRSSWRRVRAGLLPALVSAYPGSTDYFASHDFPPDFVIPPRFVPTDGGSIDFAGVDKITYASLPTNGVSEKRGVEWRGVRHNAS